MAGHSTTLNKTVQDSCSSDQTVKIGDVETGREVQTLNPKADTWSVAFSPNETRLPMKHGVAMYGNTDFHAEVSDLTTVFRHTGSAFASAIFWRVGLNHRRHFAATQTRVGCIGRSG
jgi:WD40 repeat protein